MPRLLFRANDRDGAPRAGRIEADSAEAAVAKLKAAGYSAIELHSSVSTSLLSPDQHAGLSEVESARLAAFELEARENPASVRRLLRQVLRQSRWWVGASAVLLVLGVVLHKPRWVVFAGFLLVLIFGLPVWRLRHAKRYDWLMRAWALGDWARVETLIKLLRGNGQSENFEFDLAIRSASVRAHRGELAAAITDLEPWRENLMIKAPVLFHSQVAGVYAAGGDHAAFLENMQRALALSNDEPDRLVDAALAEARFGDVAKAQDMLDRVNLEALPVYGRSFVLWARGLIALKQNNPVAQACLAQAVAEFLAHADKPTGWTALAACSGAYALALARDGKRDEALSIVQRVSPILRAHVDAPLKAELEGALGVGVLTP